MFQHFFCWHMHNGKHTLKLNTLFYFVCVHTSESIYICYLFFLFFSIQSIIISGHSQQIWSQSIEKQTVFEFFLTQPSFAPLSPKITWARGRDSLKITW